jgi:hypothetical protein
MPNHPYTLGDRVIFTDEREQQQEGVVSSIDVPGRPGCIAINVEGGHRSYVRRVTDVRPAGTDKGRTNR